MCVSVICNSRSVSMCVSVICNSRSVSAVASVKCVTEYVYVHFNMCWSAKCTYMCVFG